MKQFLLTCVCLFICLLCSANQHIQLSLREDNLSVEDIADKFNSFLNLQDDIMFTLIDQETDELGITHYRYQQFFNGVKVERAIIHIHAKDGIV